MVTLLTIEILTIIVTTITNLLAILTFSTDYWSITIYDFVKLRSLTKWIILEEIENGSLQIINSTNETQMFNSHISNIIFGLDNSINFISNTSRHFSTM